MFWTADGLGRGCVCVTNRETTHIGKSIFTATHTHTHTHTHTEEPSVFL